jgi:hypothetical protein
MYDETAVDVSAVRRWGRYMKEVEAGVAVFHDESGVVTLALQPHSFHLVDEMTARICCIKQINYVPTSPFVKSV